jgi:hypothetical protein
MSRKVLVACAHAKPPTRLALYRASSTTKCAEVQLLNKEHPQADVVHPRQHQQHLIRSIGLELYNIITLDFVCFIFLHMSTMIDDLHQRPQEIQTVAFILVHICLCCATAFYKSGVFVTTYRTKNDLDHAKHGPCAQ